MKHLTLNVEITLDEYVLGKNELTLEQLERMIKHKIAELDYQICTDVFRVHFTDVNHPKIKKLR